MKRRRLERILKKLGWRLHRNGSRHDIWTNGKWKVQVPRHNEISEGPQMTLSRRQRERRIRHEI